MRAVLVEIGLNSGPQTSGISLKGVLEAGDHPNIREPRYNTYWPLSSASVQEPDTISNSLIQVRVRFRV